MFLFWHELILTNHDSQKKPHAKNSTHLVSSRVRKSQDPSVVHNVSMVTNFRQRNSTTQVTNASTLPRKKQIKPRNQQERIKTLILLLLLSAPVWSQTQRHGVRSKTEKNEWPERETDDMTQTRPKSGVGNNVNRDNRKVSKNTTKNNLSRKTATACHSDLRADISRSRYFFLSPFPVQALMLASTFWRLRFMLCRVSSASFISLVMCDCCSCLFAVMSSGALLWGCSPWGVVTRSPRSISGEGALPAFCLQITLQKSVTSIYKKKKKKGLFWVSFCGVHLSQEEHEEGQMHVHPNVVQ